MNVPQKRYINRYIWLQITWWEDIHISPQQTWGLFHSWDSQWATKKTRLESGNWEGRMWVFRSLPPRNGHSSRASPFPRPIILGPSSRWFFWESKSYWPQNENGKSSSKRSLTFGFPICSSLWVRPREHLHLAARWTLWEIFQWWLGFVRLGWCFFVSAKKNQCK